MRFLKAVGWIWAIWLIVSLVALVSQGAVAWRALLFVSSRHYQPLLESSRSGNRCVVRRFLTLYGTVVLVNFGVFWMCFQNFLPGFMHFQMIPIVYNVTLTGLGLISVMQTASIMIAGPGVRARLDEHDPDADEW